VRHSASSGQQCGAQRSIAFKGPVRAMKGLIGIREGDCTLNAIRGLYGPCGGLIWNKKFFLTSNDGVDMMKESGKRDGADAPGGRNDGKLSGRRKGILGSGD